MSESRFYKMVGEVLGYETVSVARIQRVFAIGYARASSVVDELDGKGLLIDFENSKKYDESKKDEIKKVFFDNLSFLIKK